MEVAMTARSTAVAGDNSGVLTDDDIAALTAFYGQAIRTRRLKLEEALLAVKVARNDVNSQFKLVAADLKYTRIEFDDLLAKQDMGDKAFLASEARRQKRYELGGLLVGTQMSLDLPTVCDTADDKAGAFEDGRCAGLYGKDRDPPGKIAVIFHTDWLSGFEAGEKQLAGMMDRAGELLAARGQPAAADPVDLNEPEAEPDLDKAARDLAKTDFMQTGGPDAVAGADAETVDGGEEATAAIVPAKPRAKAA